MLHGAKEITALTTTVNTGSNGVCGSSDHLLGQVKDRNVLRGQRNLLGGQVKDLRSLSILPRGTARFTPTVEMERVGLSGRNGLSENNP